MSQAKVTNYFNARKKVPDQHAAKRRKVLKDANVTDQSSNKEKIIDDEPVIKKTVTESKLREVVTCSVDDHVLSPKTPTSSTKEAENTRSHKRSSNNEESVTPTDKSEEVVRFTPGRGDTSAKKKLDMNKAATRRNVQFTKLSNLSPKKNAPKDGPTITMPTSDQFKVPTPVKEIIGARRNRELQPTRQNVSKNLFQDESTEQVTARPKRSIRAELEIAQTKAKKLTPEEIKRLGTKTKSLDFKAELKSLIKNSKKVGDLKKSEPKPIKSMKDLLTPTKSGIEIEIPCSPSKSPMKKSVEKASPRKVPAYQRFAYLSKPVEKSLVLPFKYRMLAEVFTCMDDVVALYFNRKENITYQKLAKSVQDAMRKNFNERLLKQVKCVFPQAYFYAWHQILNKYGQKKEEYELNIEPNLNYKNDILKDYGASEEERKKGRLNGEMLIERRNIFHNSLLQMVKDQHTIFLKTLDPPIQVDEERMTRWHRDFNVDNCADIDTSDLPTKPQVEVMVTAQQVLSKANQIFNLNPRLGESLVDAAAKLKDAQAKSAPSDTPTSSSESKPAIATSTKSTPDPVLKGLEGLNPKLLEKIRAKEAEKAMLEMTRNHADIKKIKQLQKLSALARTARGLFVGERKNSLPMELVKRKLVESSPSQIDSNEMEDDLRFLSSQSEGWFRIQTVRTTDYCIINAAKNINDVCHMLEDKLKKAEQS